MTNATELGQRLRAARKEAGLSQSQAAALLDMARTTIIAIEQGKRKKVHPHELEAFASVYGVSAQSLTEETPTTEEALQQAGGIHVYLGYSRHKADKGEHCLYCGAKEHEFAYTYFGAPVCGRCWDEHWRQTEDGQTDPPFVDIKNQCSGYWV